MDKPRALAPGDRLAVVAPASGFDRQDFDDGIEELRTLGFEPVWDESVFARQEYVAGPASLRARAVRSALTDSSIAGIIGVRGGYGSAQILPLLDPSEIRRSAKPFIGYSDLTAVLTYYTHNCGLVAFHGPTVDRIGRGAIGYDRDSFIRTLTAAVAAGELTAPGVETVRPGDFSGPLYGGTVTQLLASLATPFAFNPPDEYVLLFEEIAERPYRLDRMFEQLRQSGLLSRARAVVIGQLLKCDEPSGRPTGRGVMADLLADFPGPVVIGFPTGHTDGPALTLPIGVKVRVVAGTTPRVIVEEAAVR